MDTSVSNRAELLALLRKSGYAGKDDIAEVRSFLVGSDFEMDDAALDAVWAVEAKPVAKRGIKVEAPAPAPEAKDDGLAALKAEIDNLKRSLDKADAKASDRTRIAAPAIAGPAHYARSAYNRKAKAGVTAFPDADIAEAFGAHVRTAVAKVDSKYAEYPQQSRDAEIVKSFQRASATNINSSGGAFIPAEFMPMLIELREQYGVFPRAVGTMTTNRDNVQWVRNTADQTVYWTGESTAPTQSDPSTDNPSVTLNKLLGLSLNPSELLEDSAINVGEYVARSFARESARKIDDAGFNGTGTSSYGQFTGLAGKFAQLGATVANTAGWVSASGNTKAAVTAGDLNIVAGRLPVYAMQGAKWYMHSTVYWTIANRLKLAQGGSTGAEMTAAPQFSLLGYPVEFVQVMPSADTASTIIAYLGNLSLGCKFFTHSSGISVERNDSRYFDTDQVAFRFRERCGIVVHDIGNYHATAASRVVGPVVALALSA